MSKTTRKRAVVLSLAMLIISLLTPAAAFASSYNSTFNFFSTLTGAGRSYSHNNMNISMTAKTVARLTNAPATKAYTVTLQRSNLLGWTRIGSVSCSANRTGIAGSGRWTNVNSGTYRFYFSTSEPWNNDIISNNVVMYCN